MAACAKRWRRDKADCRQQNPCRHSRESGTAFAEPVPGLIRELQTRGAQRAPWMARVIQCLLSNALIFDATNPGYRRAIPG